MRTRRPSVEQVPDRVVDRDVGRGDVLHEVDAEEEAPQGNQRRVVGRLDVVGDHGPVGVTAHPLTFHLVVDETVGVP